MCLVLEKIIKKAGKTESELNKKIKEVSNSCIVDLNDGGPSGKPILIMHLEDGVQLAHDVSRAIRMRKIKVINSEQEIKQAKMNTEITDHAIIINLVKKVVGVVVVISKEINSKIFYWTLAHHFEIYKKPILLVGDQGKYQPQGWLENLKHERNAYFDSSDPKMIERIWEGVENIIKKSQEVSQKGTGKEEEEWENWTKEKVQQWAIEKGNDYLANRLAKIYELLIFLFF